MSSRPTLGTVRFRSLGNFVYPTLPQSTQLQMSDVALTSCKTRHPVCHFSDLDYADDIVLFADTIQEAELLFHKVESVSKSTGTQAKQSTSISTCLLMTVYTLQMGVKLRKYRILNILDPTQTHNMTSSVEKPRHGQQFTSLTNFRERLSADSPN